MNRKSLAIITFFVVAMMFTMACGMVDTLLGMGRSSGTVNQLWSDVPPLDGARKADLEMPMAAQLVIRTVAQGKMDFIAFTTDKSAPDVMAFYTKERMQKSGWNAEEMPGCTGDATTNEVGALCVFGKKDGGREIILGIIVAEDQETNQTQLFYVKIDITEQAESAQ